MHLCNAGKISDIEYRDCLRFFILHIISSRDLSLLVILQQSPPNRQHIVGSVSVNMSYRAGILTGLVAIVGAYIALYSYFCLLSGQSYTLLSPPPDLLEIVTAIQTSVANGPTKPITAFEVGGLWMSNSLDETRTSRQWHLGFNFRDLIAIPPEGTRCDMIWPASDDPPTYMVSNSHLADSVVVTNNITESVPESSICPSGQQLPEHEAV